MTPDVVIAMIGFASLAVWFVYVLFFEGRTENRLRHRRCLANTDRLERELFPHWFEDEPASSNYVQAIGPYQIIDEEAPAPAQRWGIEHGMIYQREFDAARAVMLKQMVARGMLYSGETKRAIVSRRRPR